VTLLRRAVLSLALLFAAGPALADGLPPVTAADRFLGRSDAPVTVVEYASLTCSHCAAWHTTILPTFKARFIDTGKVRLVYRDLPTPPADVAATGAGLARCAAPERFFDVVGTLMNNQAMTRPGGDVGPWYDAGVAASGRTREQIETCLADPSTITNLRAGIEGGRGAGVAGTPTFFVNGQKVADGSMETLAAAVESAIR